MATFNGRLRQLMKEKGFTQHKLAKRTFFDGKELIVRKETSVFDYAIEEDGLLISSKILNVRTQPLSGYAKKWKEVIYKTYDNEVRFCYARTLTSLETGEETTFTYTCKDSLKGYVYHLDYEIDSEHLKYEDIISGEFEGFQRDKHINISDMLGKYVVANNGKKYKFLRWDFFFNTLYGTFEGHGIKVNSYTDNHGRQCFGIIDNNGCGYMYTKEEFLNIFGKKD